MAGLAVSDTAPAAVRWDGPGLDGWDPWTPDEMAARLAGLDATWCVAGGWSIDLFLGRATRPTRPHADLEIATVAANLPAIRQHLSPFVFHAVGGGSVRRLGPGQAGPGEWHQHWVLDEPAQAWRVDVMVEPGDEQQWVYRRDSRVRAARADMVGRSREGVPFLLPHGALLYKAKALRDKDQADFDAVVARLDRPSARWLANALQLLHPGHPWLDRLRE